MKNTKARLWAYYLPQFHQIPENDEWWGKGFTEWTNVRKAKPLFPGHHQPVEPGELGYYDLVKQPEIRERQAELAKEYGIEGFVYWHYWFGNGKMLLERPFAEVLKSGRPDFPFALAWANESWRGFWHGLDNERQILISQEYPGEVDTIAHFNYVLTAFKDPRYLRIDGKPVFFVYKPLQNPYMSQFLLKWRKLAEENDLPGIYFIGITGGAYGKSAGELTIIPSNSAKITDGSANFVSTPGLDIVGLYDDGFILYNPSESQKMNLSKPLIIMRGCDFYD